MPVQISNTCSRGDPEIGPRLDNGKWRALVGWNHSVDTAAGIKDGKIWCWVSTGPQEKFQVYDQNFNRGEKGEVRDCGVANFTMIRMFHPYWCLRTRGGEPLTPPRDGESVDKEYCRTRYKELIQRHRIAVGLPVDETPEEYARRMIDENKKSNMGARRHQARQKDQATGVGSIALPAEETMPGRATADPMCVDHSDEDDNESNDSQDRRGENSSSNHVRHVAHKILCGSKEDNTSTHIEPLGIGSHCATRDHRASNVLTNSVVHDEDISVTSHMGQALECLSQWKVGQPGAKSVRPGRSRFGDSEHDKLQASCCSPSSHPHVSLPSQRMPLSRSLASASHNDTDMTDAHKVPASMDKSVSIFVPVSDIKDELSDAEREIVRASSHFSEHTLEGLLKEYPIVID